MVSSFYFDKGDFAPSQQDALVLEIASLGKKEAALLAVCDGIGGLEEGEYAGSYVTMRIRRWFYEDYLTHRKKGHGRKRIERDCIGMLYDCNRYLRHYGKTYNMKLGTTMTMALLYGKKLFGKRGACPFMEYMIFHAGDSRACLFGKKQRILTKDDNVKGHALSRCIGSFPWQGVYKSHGRIYSGERLLLCSDGFWRRLGEEEMAESFGKYAFFLRERRLTETQLEKRMQKLGNTGRTRGEKDNQAAVAVEI